MIPKTFHQIWIGPADLPDGFKRSTDRLLKLHPDWDYKLWTDDNLPELLNQQVVNEMLEKNDDPDMPGKYWNVISDCYRYEIIARHGGVYLDCDILPIKPFDELIEGHTEVLTEENSETLNNCFIAAAPNHPFLWHLVWQLETHHHATKRHHTPFFSAGVFNYSQVAKEWPEHLHVLPYKAIIPMSHLPPFHIMQNVDVEIDRMGVDECSYAMHFWNHKGVHPTNARIKRFLDKIEEQEKDAIK